MSLAAYVILVFSFFAALGLATTGAIQMLRGRARGLNWLEFGHLGITIGLGAAMGSLLLSLLTGDFSVAYVAAHTDLSLSVFYRVTALWAGQEGSLLLWAFSAAVICLIFQVSRVYSRLGETTRFLFWVFHFLIMALFLLLLVTWNNPFAGLLLPPSDGQGLNPVLRHPGMLFHPPLLLLGYAGFIMPACLAAAQAFTGRKGAEYPWIMLIRPYTLIAWVFLTGGIILGAWWAYMELGWGGYWAWDPVENASLLPWLTATAFLHTALVERRQQRMARANVFLVTLTFSATLFATWLTRSGAVPSIHAFSASSVGLPLSIAVSISLAVSLAAAAAAKPASDRSLPDILSRNGLMLLGMFLLLGLGVIIAIAALWPLLSGLWQDSPTMLTPAFYNHVCLPLFIAVTGLIFTAFLRGAHGPFPWKSFLAWLLILGAPLSILLGSGYPLSTAAIILALGVACLAFRCLPRLWSPKAPCDISMTAYGVHLGFALIVLGIAVSAPYKMESRVSLAVGEKAALGPYVFTLENTEFAVNPEGNRSALTAHIRIRAEEDGHIGTLSPTRSYYAKYDQTVSEAATLSSLQQDIHITLLGSENNQFTLLLSIHPLVNFIWLGGLLLCLFAAIRLHGHKAYRHGGAV